VPSETNNTTDEFSPVVRRFLREREMVDCHGFDIDLATAYLEQSLTARVQLDFEGHLADCPPCRRHLTELAQLAQLAQLAGSAVANEPLAPLPAAAEIFRAAEPDRSWLAALREAFTAPFRMPAFGVVGVALLVALVTAGLVWNRAADPQTPADPASQLASRTEPSGQVSNLINHTGDTGPTTSGTPGATASEATRQRERTVQPGAATTTRTATPESTLAAATEVDRPALPVATELDRQVPTLRAPESVNQPRSSLQLNVNTGQRNSRSASTFRMPDFAEVNGFAAPRQPRSFANPAESDLESVVRIIHGKTFKLEGRTWVDQEYHQLMRSNGSVTMVRGDQNYEKLVADTPILADFFSLRNVTVVWNGKVYRVLAQ